MRYIRFGWCGSWGYCKHIIMRKFVNQWGIYIVSLGEKDGSVQSGTRPCVILQNAIGNSCSPTTICLPITSSQTKSSIPPHYTLYRKDYPFFDCEENTVLCEQVTTIDVSKQVQKYLGMLNVQDRQRLFCKFIENFKQEE